MIMEPASKVIKRACHILLCMFFSLLDSSQSDLSALLLHFTMDCTPRIQARALSLLAFLSLAFQILCDDGPFEVTNVQPVICSVTSVAYSSSKSMPTGPIVIDGDWGKGGQSWTISADHGIEISDLSQQGSSGAVITFTKSADGSYGFTMPDGGSKSFILALDSRHPFPLLTSM